MLCRASPISRRILLTLCRSICPLDRISAIRELCIAHGHTPGRIGTLVEQPGANNQRNRLAYVDCASIEDASKLKTSLDRARKSQARPATISFRRTKAAEPSTELFISGIPSNSTEQSASWAAVKWTVHKISQRAC